MFLKTFSLHFQEMYSKNTGIYSWDPVEGKFSQSLRLFKLINQNISY